MDPFTALAIHVYSVPTSGDRNQGSVFVIVLKHSDKPVKEVNQR